MPRRSIKQVLMERDGLSAEEADSRIEQARQELYDHLECDDELDQAYDICMDHFGLEPDYLMDLL